MKFLVGAVTPPTKNFVFDVYHLSRLKCTMSCLRCTYGFEGANEIRGGGGEPTPPTRVCDVPLCEREESVSFGPGLLSFPPIAVEVYQVAFQMYKVAFEVYLQIPRHKWNLWCGGG